MPLLPSTLQPYALLQILSFNAHPTFAAYHLPSTLHNTSIHQTHVMSTSYLSNHQSAILKPYAQPYRIYNTCSKQRYSPCPKHPLCAQLTPSTTPAATPNSSMYMTALATSAPPSPSARTGLLMRNVKNVDRKLCKTPVLLVRV